VNEALEAGISFFDTADIYGGTKSEEFLGKALGPRRKDVIVATKFGMKVSNEKQGARPEYICQAVEDSLRRLGTDYIDLYQLHRPDPEVPVADTLGALDDLVKAGKVREIGCSNFSAEQLREAASAVRPDGAKYVSVQNHYSLFKRDDEREVLPLTEQMGLAYLPYFPLANGLLTGKYRIGQQVPEGTRIKPDSDALTEENLDKVEALIRFAQAQGHTLLELAFSWLLTKPSVASVIAGATKAEQVKKNASAACWQMRKADLAAIDKIIAPPA
jgi:aryl-alcohol dehydrogenase-like predicted oxidoreductase